MTAAVVVMVVMIMASLMQSIAYLRAQAELAATYRYTTLQDVTSLLSYLRAQAELAAGREDGVRRARVDRVPKVGIVVAEAEGL